MPNTGVEAHHEKYALLRRHPDGATIPFSLCGKGGRNLVFLLYHTP
jgi:hypothetical protein